ncbi:olfactory receptor 7D4-like [Cynocephalus volans]|uniref:olfactory receptor 7D4-like n=1 Tax=Cynocephalus volans TaxID=110931 RepID=UPI002FC5F02C
MEAENHTELSEFLPISFSENSELKPLLLGLFLSVSLVTVHGNLLIILAIISDSHLHTPMYFFLSNLSFIDICFISTITPQMLVNIQEQSKDIFYIECLAQMYFLMIFAGVDNFLLTIMAYDCFVAICHPLHYTVTMTSHLCALLFLMSWFIICWASLLQILLMKRLTFSTGTEILHFFCNLSQFLKVACSDTLINNIFLYVAAALLWVFPVIGILFSYYHIVSSLMKMFSIAGKYKAFYTCGSQLSMVSLYYGTSLGDYVSSVLNHSSQRSLITSVMYTVVTPMVNPFLYNLRNKVVMRALGRLFSRAACCP